jgi:hypothetical protein
MVIEPFAEYPPWHSAIALSLPSACWTSAWQRRLQWAPLLVPLPSALGGTRQRLPLCRVPVGLALGKGSTSGPLCLSLCRVHYEALGKGCFFAEYQSRSTRQRSFTGSQMYLFAKCYTRQSDQKTPFLFVLILHPNKQKIYIIDITYITESTHVSPTPYISKISPHQTIFTTHKSPTLTNISLKYLTKYYQHQQVQTKLSHKVLPTPTNIRSSARWEAGLVRWWVGRSMRVVSCCRLSLHWEEIACVRLDEYISCRTKILILTGVWNWEGSAGGNNRGSGAKPYTAPRLCMYWNISAILCWSTKRASRFALILASISICSLLSYSSWACNISPNVIIMQREGIWVWS